MALDRQSVEKKDFPIARRGYEPEAVDAHLARLAGEIEALQRQRGSGREGGASLALAASEQVRAIVEAAETSAADIEAAARDDAARIKAEAEGDARGTRDEAVAKSQEHVGKVSEATTLMLQRVDAMESELGALLESLRTGSNRLNADLTLLTGNMGELYGAAGSTPPAAAAEPAPAPAEAAPAAPAGLFTDTGSQPITDEEIDTSRLAGASLAFASGAGPPTPEETEPPATQAAEPSPPAPAPPQAGGDADEGARLVAFNMALDGTPREEVDRYLAENFDIADRARLLDEVYATVG